MAYLPAPRFYLRHRRQGAELSPYRLARAVESPTRHHRFFAASPRPDFNKASYAQRSRCAWCARVPAAPLWRDTRTRPTVALDLSSKPITYLAGTCNRHAPSFRERVARTFG